MRGGVGQHVRLKIEREGEGEQEDKLVDESQDDAKVHL